MYDSWGNTIAVYDANGQPVTSETHLAVQNPIRYRGYYWDSETGLYYLQSRYYDPVVGRFVNADSVSDANAGVIGYNMYTYCANNPANGCDPSGHSILLTLLGKAAIGAAIGAITNIASQVIQKKSFSEINLKDVAIEAGVSALTSVVSFGLGSAIKSVANASRVVKAAAIIASGGITKTIGDTCRRVVKGEDVTITNTAQSFVQGSVATGISMGISSAINKVSFDRMTKSQKHSALNSTDGGSKITHRDIRNGLHKGTMNNFDFLTNRTEQVETCVSFFTELVGG